jgi:3-hydroxyacyl-[acyl-carrier-protein] dehydratase
MNMRDTILAARLGEPHTDASGATTAGFRFEADVPVFAGHFPGNPLLPGVFQLEMTRVVAEMVLGGTLAIREVIKAKFTSPIVPGEVVQVDVKPLVEAPLMQARAIVRVGDRTAGEVILQLAREP